MRYNDEAYPSKITISINLFYTPTVDTQNENLQNLIKHNPLPSNLITAVLQKPEASKTEELSNTKHVPIICTLEPKHP